MTVFYFFGHAAHGILILWPQVEPKPPTVEVPHPNHWTTSKFLPPHTFLLLSVSPMLSNSEFPKMRLIVTISYKMPSYDTVFGSLLRTVNQETTQLMDSYPVMQLELL